VTRIESKRRVGAKKIEKKKQTQNPDKIEEARCVFQARQNTAPLRFCKKKGVVCKKIKKVEEFAEILTQFKKNGKDTRSWKEGSKDPQEGRGKEWKTHQAC